MKNVNIKIDVDNTLFIVSQLSEEDGCVSGADILSWAIERRNNFFNPPKENKKKLPNKNDRLELTLVLNCPGGSFTHLIQLYDGLTLLKNVDIRTVTIGYACSAAAILAIMGTKGKRFISENSALMFHEAFTVGGEEINKASQIIDEYKQLASINDKMLDFIVKHTNLTRLKAKRFVAKDKYVYPTEALKLGMVDGVIGSIE